MFLNLINPLFSFFPSHGTGDLEIGDAYELADKIKKEKKEVEVNNPPVFKRNLFKFGKWW